MPSRPIRLGGLMRCCLETIRNSAPTDPVEEQHLPCQHCSHGAVFRSGAWEWHRGVAPSPAAETGTPSGPHPADGAHPAGS